MKSLNAETCQATNLLKKKKKKKENYTIEQFNLWNCVRCTGKKITIFSTASVQERLVIILFAALIFRVSE